MKKTKLFSEGDRIGCFTITKVLACGEKGEPRYEVKCRICGEMSVVSERVFLSGIKACSMCGISKSRLTKERNAQMDKKFIGQPFGSLTVVRRLGSTRTQKSGLTTVTYECRCKCGRITTRTNIQLERGRTETLTCGWSKCISELLGCDKIDDAELKRYIAEMEVECTRYEQERLDNTGRVSFTKRIFWEMNLLHSNWVINSGNTSHTSTGVVGVNKTQYGFLVTIGWQRRSLRLGTFQRFEDAVLVRLEAEIWIRHHAEVQVAKHLGAVPPLPLEEKLKRIGLDKDTPSFEVVGFIPNRFTPRKP